MIQCSGQSGVAIASGKIAHRPHGTSLLIDPKHMVSPARSFSTDLGRCLPRNCRLAQCCSLVAFMAIMLGCAEDTSIRQYRVAKSETQRNTAAASMSSTATPAKEQLMLAAIVPNQDFAWFFKLTGDPEKVLKSDAEFRGMVKSVAFDGQGQPTWKLHEGWQQQITPDAITYGKLTNDEAGLTATVTRLPFTSSDTEDSWRGYIVSNINRWRKQLSLEQQEWEQMSGELEEFPELSQGPAKAYFVSIAGSGSGGMAAPFMNRSAASPAPAAPRDAAGTATGTATGSPADGSPTAGGSAAPTSASSGKPITYTVPEGWQETAASGMRMASFNIGQGEAVGEVTVIAAGGGIEANIGIWLGQVGVEANADTTARILAESQEVTVNSLAAKLYTIDGPEAATTATPAASDEGESAQATAEPAEAAAEAEAEEAEAEAEAAAAAEASVETVADADATAETDADIATQATVEETADREQDAGDVTPDAADVVTEQPAAASGQAESESILIADIPWRDGQSLFVKFKGPKSLADAQREAFIEFIKSIEWK